MGPHFDQLRVTFYLFEESAQILDIASAAAIVKTGAAARVTSPKVWLPLEQGFQGLRLAHTHCIHQRSLPHKYLDWLFDGEASLHDLLQRLEIVLLNCFD